MLRLLKQLTILISILLFLAGCWDEIEIEQRAFVSGVAVDLAEEQSSSKTKIELTSQFIVPKNLGTSNGGGGNGPAYQNLTKTGETIFDTNREMLKEASRKIDVTHLDIVLFSEDFVKQPNLFSHSVDVFLREKNMRRGIIIAITSGTAKELLTVDPENEKVPSQYFKKLVEIKGNLAIIKTVRVGDIQEKVLQKESFPLPLLKKKDSKSVNYDGVAIFNGPKSKMVGELKGLEAKGLSFLIEEKHTGVLNIEVEGQPATIEILKIKKKISLEYDNPSNLRFLFTIDVSGTIAEQLGNQNVMNTEIHEKFEKGLAKKIEEITTKTVEKLQKDLQTDVLGLGVYLKNYHPKLWAQTKDNWEKGENYFSTSKIDFQVNTNIQRPGSMNRTSDGSRD